MAREENMKRKKKIKKGRERKGRKDEGHKEREEVSLEV
jgi:hypothetical protein